MQRLISCNTNSRLPRPFFLITVDECTTQSSKIHDCDCCDLQFFSPLELKIHKYSDEDSNGIFSSGVSLNTHNSGFSTLMNKTNNHLEIDENKLEEKPIEEVYGCKKCSKKFLNFKGLQQHLGKIHDEESKNSVCHICSKKFRHKHAVKFHISQVHEKATRITCSYCQKSLYNKYLLDSHVKRCRIKLGYY